MASMNEDLLNAAIRHQVSLLRFSEGEAKRAVKLLAKGEAELLDLLKSGPSEFSQARLNGMLRDIRAMRSALIDQVKAELTDSLQSLAEVEANWEHSTLQATVPVEYAFNAVTPQAVKAIVSTPIQGIPLEGWMDNIKAADQRRIEQQVQMGFLQGETIPQISKRLRDQALATTTRNAEALARTAVNHVSQNARAEVWNQNKDVLDGLRWTATLDGRTTEICMSRDGTVYPHDPKSPKPPAHFQCRSLLVAVIDGIALVGDRPFVRDTRTRKTRETDFREEAKVEAGDKWKGMTEAQRKAAIKARRDKWTAENIGQVPAKTSYNEWLKNQPKEFQDEVLGKGKADLFRSGVTLDKFVDEAGKPYSMDELKARYAADKMDVIQPGVGLKAKSYLSQGLTNDQVLSKLQAEYPDSKVSAGSIASYKTELKKLGMLDELVGTGGTTSAGGALGVQKVLDGFEASLPSGVKSAVGGSWANVVEDLQGSPGAYGSYLAGKGVQLSAKKLGAVSAVQAQQVMAHELGHLLHKQHNLKLSPMAFQSMKAKMATFSDVGKKAYSYFMSHPDEMTAEVFAQVLSPSPFTSQGLSAQEFKTVLADVLEDAQFQLQQKFPKLDVPPMAPKGPPVAVYEVAGTHSTVGGLAKALLQQGMPDEDVLQAIKAQFPNAKTGLNSIKSYKSELKKAGKIKPPHSGPEVSATKAAVTTPEPMKAETAAVVPPITGPVPLPAGSSLKKEAEKLFNAGLLDNNEVAKVLNEKFIIPAGSATPKATNVASWKVAWKKADPSKAVKAVKTEVKAAAKAVNTGPKPPPLYGKPLGPTSTKALKEAKQLYASGANMMEAMKLANKFFVGGADPVKYGDLWDLAKYEVDTAKAAGKPYLESTFKPVPKPVSLSNPFGSTPARNPNAPDMAPSRPASSPFDGRPPPPRFNKVQQDWAIRQRAGNTQNHLGGFQATNAKQRKLGLPELTEQEFAALKSYTGNTYRSVNKELRDGKYAGNQVLQAYTEAGQMGIDKLPSYNPDETLFRGVSIQRGSSDWTNFLKRYQPGAVVTEDNFTSTSFGGRAAFSGMNVRMVFVPSKARRGVNVAPFSNYKNENEVLLPPGQRLKVLNVQQNYDGKDLVVTVQEID